MDLQIELPAVTEAEACVAAIRCFGSLQGIDTNTLAKICLAIHDGESVDDFLPSILEEQRCHDFDIVAEYNEVDDRVILQPSTSNRTVTIEGRHNPKVTIDLGHSVRLRRHIAEQVHPYLPAVAGWQFEIANKIEELADVIRNDVPAIYGNRGIPTYRVIDGKTVS